MNLGRIAARPLQQFLLSTTAIAIAFAVRVQIPPLSETPYVIFFPIVTAFALYAGLWPGLFTMVLSAMAASISFGPGHSVQFDVPGHSAGLIAFLSGNIIIIVICSRLRSEIIDRKRAEESLKNALTGTQQRQAEISALLRASRAVLEQREFKDITWNIFDSCKNLIGATAGYVALLSEDGTENEVLFLDSGGLPCTVDPSLPMPIRGLREVVYRTGKAVYENDFSHSEWMKFMPEGHTNLDNVLFAPLVIQGQAVGLLGLGNKTVGFTENDAKLASAFGELAAIALHNSRLVKDLQKSKDMLEIRVEERTVELGKTMRELEEEISERIRAEDALKIERRRLSDVLEMLPAYVVLLTPDYHVPFANRFFRERFGESHGRRCFEFLFGRSEPCEICETYKALKTMAPHEWEWTGPDKRNYHIFDYPFTDIDGSTFILEMGIDITERKETESRISLNNELLTLLSQTFSREEYLDSTTSLFHEWSGCRCIGIRIPDKYGNIPYESYKGFSREFWEMENFLSVNRDRCVCTKIMAEKPDAQDMPFMTKHGSFYSNDTQAFIDGLNKAEKTRYRATCIKAGFMSLSVIPIRHNEKVIGVIHIADERKGMVPLKVVESIEAITPLVGEAIHRFDIEDEVRQSSVLLENIFSNIHVLIAYMDPEFNFIRVNRLYAEADGREPEFYIGKNHFDLFPNKENEAVFRKVVTTGESYFVYAKPFEYAEYPERGVTYWDWSLQPVKGASGDVTGLVLSLINVTEKILLQAEAMQTAHLASLGELAAGVAHEINNPLNGMINYAQMLVNKMSKDSKENEIAARIIKEGGRIAIIVRSLLSFARKKSEEKGILDVSEILSESLLLSEAQMLKENIKLKVNMPKDMPKITAHAQQIQQVFLNVINNARYALNQKYPGRHKDKELEITGEIITVDERQYSRISFYDRGMGIPADIIDKVINPFFSTKPSGKGTGLGLSISHGIIQDHGGKLGIESAEGEFTRIIIDLPAAVRK